MTNDLIKTVVLVVFAGLNAVLLYLFLLQLPYGIATFKSSLLYWSRLSPRIEIVVGISAAVALLALIAVRWLDSEWKSRLVYFRHKFAHPGHFAFFGGKDPGFDRKPLLLAYPEIRDSAYDPNVQMRVWTQLLKRHEKAPLVVGTHRSWLFLRDLYLISLVFLAAFLLAWPLNFGIPQVVGLSYVFVYGAQYLFLMFSARSTGMRLECNVLAQELKLKPGHRGKQRKRSSRKR